MSMMGAVRFGLLVGVAAVAAWLAGPAAATEVRWSAFDVPSPGAPQVIGTYANGCIGGAVALPPDGPGYQAVRLGRNRFYGHPELIDMLQALGRRVADAGLGTMLVGDVAQPRGGPMPQAHASHQTGLDADIWLRLDLPPLPRSARDGVHATLMVDRAWFRPDTSVWGDRQAMLVRLAAADPRVERIFIHPALKHDLCRRDWPDRSWLGRVRPWYGHDSHFHVRLSCPADSPDCTPQEPPPPGDGCDDELLSWFPKTLPVVPGVPAAEPPEPRKPRVLPAACRAVVAGGE